MKAEQRDAKEKRQQHELDDKVAAVLDAQQSETGNVEKTQRGSQKSEHGRHVVRPNASKFPSRFLLRIHISIRITIPPIFQNILFIYFVCFF